MLPSNLIFITVIFPKRHNLYFSKNLNCSYHRNADPIFIKICHWVKVKAGNLKFSNHQAIAKWSNCHLFYDFWSFEAWLCSDSLSGAGLHNKRYKVRFMKKHRKEEMLILVVIFVCETMLGHKSHISCDSRSFDGLYICLYLVSGPHLAVLFHCYSHTYHCIYIRMQNEMKSLEQCTGNGTRNKSRWTWRCNTKCWWINKKHSVWRHTDNDDKNKWLEIFASSLSILFIVKVFVLWCTQNCWLETITLMWLTFPCT